MNLKPLSVSAVLYLAVHCSATRPSQDIGAKEIDRWHRDRGFYCIGYHYVIRRNGFIEKGRPDDVMGAHVLGYNACSLGICWVGGVSERDINRAEDNRTPDQTVALAKLLKQLKQRYKVAIVQGHRDFPNVAKACPSFDVKPWWETVKQS